MSVHDIFKSVSTSKVHRKIPIENSSSPSEGNSSSDRLRSPNTPTGVLSKRADSLGIPNPSSLTIPSFMQDIYDPSFIQLQNSLEKARQWRFLRASLYFPSLALYAKSNKVNLQRFEKRLFDFIESRAENVKIKVPDASKAHFLNLCRYYFLIIQEIRVDSSDSNSFLISIGRSLESRVPEISLSSAFPSSSSSSSLSIPSVSTELPVLIFVLTDDATQLAPSLLPARAPFQVHHLLAYIAEAVGRIEPTQQGGIKLMDVQVKGPSTVCIKFASMEDAVQVYESVSDHVVNVYLLDKGKSSKPLSSSCKMKFKDLFRISAAFDLAFAKDKYSSQFSSVSTPMKPTSQGRSASDASGLELDAIMSKFQSSDSNAGGEYRRLVLQPRSPDLPPPLPPVPQSIEKVYSNPADAMSPESPTKAMTAITGRASLSAASSQESLVDEICKSDHGLRNRFNILDEDDDTDNMRDLQDDEACDAVKRGFRAGHRELQAADFTCPITREVIHTAMRSKYGHYYEREAILEWVSSRHLCPLTKLPLEIADLTPSSNRYDACLRRFHKENVISMIS